MRRAATAVALVLFALDPVFGQTFVRGDVNEDSHLDIADPVKTLLHLFSGGGRVDCADRADSNDDGRVDVSDAVSLLGYLFLGTAPPPPPFPEPGEDPTPDLLCCGPTCDPDIAGVWSGTFVDDTEGEYVVYLRIEDGEQGTWIAEGLESVGNQIFGGEVFVWGDAAEIGRLGFAYFTSFDVVEGDFTLSADGNRMENGEFSTSSGTGGSFSMARASSLEEPFALHAGPHRIVFVDLEDTTAWGGSFVLEEDGRVGEGHLAAVPLEPSASQIDASPDPHDEEMGVYTGILEDTLGYRVSLLGLAAADTGHLSGAFTDTSGLEGIFLMAALETP